MTRSRALALFCALGLGPAARLHALDPGRDPSAFLRQRWDAEGAFPGGAVHAIAQDADGALWIGAERGLVRYDGAAFRLTTFPDGGPVLGVVVDAGGAVWIRRHAPALQRWRGGRLETAPGLDPMETAITAMARGRDGSLLLTALVSGAQRRRGERTDALAPPNLLPNGLVVAMADDGARVFLGTRDAGLYTLAAGGAVVPVPGPLPDRKVNAVLALSPRDAWVGTDAGAVRFDGERLTRAGVPAALARAPVLALLRDADGNVWAGTASGLARVRADGGAAVLDASFAVTALFEDREGGLWAGGPGGLLRLRDPRFARTGGAGAAGRGAVHVDAVGRAWFAPAAGGLVLAEGGRAERVSADGLDTDVVYALAPASSGVWAARQRGGLSHLRVGAGGRVTALTYGTAEGLPADAVYSVLEARDGTVWAGTLRSGAVALRGGRFARDPALTGPAAETVTALAEDASGTVFLGTPRGLQALKAGRARTYRAADGLPADDVTCLLAEDVLWVGTTGGLAMVTDGRVVRPDVPDGLRAPVVGVAAGRDGWLWVATASQLVRVRRASLLAGRAAEADVVAYGAPDGLEALEVARRQRSLATAAGRVFLATARGLFVADEARALRPAVPVVARVEALGADGQAAPADGTARLPARPRRVTVAYAGLSLAAPERVRFRYRLDGFDGGWSESAGPGEAVYTNLGPGAYVFRVRASDADGQWSGPEAALPFTIVPAPWQRRPLQLAFGLAAALAVGAAFRFRLRREQSRLQRLFEERLAERTRIAQELHDTLLQGFLSASLQLHVAVDALPEQAPGRTQLARVLDLMRRVIDDGRNALRGLRAATGAESLERAFSRIGQELGVSEAVPFRVFAVGEERPVQEAVRAEAYGIGREALLNAIRHARAQHVEVEIDYAGADLRLVVRDDGCGIPGGVLDSGREGHWGLSGMRERAEKIGGRLRLSSAAGAGTEVELTVPGRVAFGGGASAR
ncbi:MAG: two-component regulator propeller domain-containing protein [Vicinamibacteria bacterium]